MAKFATRQTDSASPLKLRSVTSIARSDWRRQPRPVVKHQRNTCNVTLFQLGMIGRSTGNLSINLLPRATMTLITGRLATRSAAETHAVTGLACTLGQSCRFSVRNSINDGRVRANDSRCRVFAAASHDGRTEDLQDLQTV